jgi:branched-chain amino acid transport system substrate-binding protein
MNKQFVDAFKSRYDLYPSYNAHGAYGAVYTYKAAVEKAQSDDKEAVMKALEDLTVELPVGTITVRAGDHQAVTDVTWGKTAADPAYPIRVLKPFRVFKGADVTPPVADTGCTIQ